MACIGSGRVILHELGEEYVVTFVARGPDAALPRLLTVVFEYMYTKEVEVHSSRRVYENLPVGRHKYVWKNLGAQNLEKGDIASWRVTLQYDGVEVAEKRSALWRPWGKVVLDE